MLTYFGRWDFVERKQNTQLSRSCYVAPGQWAGQWVGQCMARVLWCALDKTCCVQVLWEISLAPSQTTVESPIKDPLRKGQSLCIGRSSKSLSHRTNTFRTSKKRTTSLQRTTWLAPKCPLFRGSTKVGGWVLH